MYGDKGYEEVREVVESTLHHAQRMQAARAIALCQCFNGALEFQAGNWTRAEESLRQSIALYREIGAASGEALARQRLGVVLTARGQFDEALHVLEEGAAVAERAVMRAHCLARLYASMAHNRLEAGDFDAAGDVLREGLNMSKRHGNCTTCDALLLPVAVRVHTEQGELETAAEFCRQLEEAAARYGSRTWVAMSRQAHGRLAAARGKHEEALQALDETTAGFRQAGFDYEAARCLSAAAEIRRQRATPHDIEKASRLRREAERIYATLDPAS
ncbi:MAG: tetratricopeptide repeat protein [Anaerolineae bacterium]|nr:tetratricopeptide repeat protein [Anaerolineae bacterium]